MTVRAIEKIQQSVERRLRKIHVEEWDLDIYVGTWTLEDSKRIKGLASQDSPATWAAIVQIKALDENGEKLFDMKDRERLIQIGDSEILQRLALQIGKPIRSDATHEDPEFIESLPSLDELTGEARKNS